MTSGPGADGVAEEGPPTPGGERTPPAAPPAAPAADSDQPFLADRIVEDAALALEKARDRTGPTLQWPLTLVLVGLVMSLLIVADDHFRRGSVLFAGFVLLAFLLRLLLSDQDAGWLAMRRRRIDLMCLGVLATGVSVFALIVPAPS